VRECKKEREREIKESGTSKLQGEWRKKCLENISSVSGAKTEDSDEDI